MGACGLEHDKICCPSHFKHHEECHHGEQGHQDDMHIHYFLELADKAWQEVLKDKIKAYILETQDDHMTKLAKIIAEGNNHRWRNRIAKKQSCKDFIEELCKFFEQVKK